MGYSGFLNRGRVDLRPVDLTAWQPDPLQQRFHVRIRMVIPPSWDEEPAVALKYMELAAAPVHVVHREHAAVTKPLTLLNEVLRVLVGQLTILHVQEAEPARARERISGLGQLDQARAGNFKV